MKRSIIVEWFFSLTTTGLLVLGAYATYTNVVSFLLGESNRMPVLAFLGVWSVLPFLILFFGQLLRMRSVGSKFVLCLTAIVVAGPSILASRHRPPASYGWNPFKMLFDIRSYASIDPLDLGVMFFFASVRLGVVALGLTIAFIVRRWEELPDNDQMQLTAPAPLERRS